MRDPRNLGKYAFVEGGRDPTSRTRWGTRASEHPPPIDRCQCLRASGPDIQVFALGEGEGELSLDRSLRIRERAALQGFPDAIACVELPEKAGRRIFGNAMSVPVIGSVLAEELKCIHQFYGIQRKKSGGATDGHPLPLPSPGRPIKSSIGPKTMEFYDTWYASDDEECEVMLGSALQSSRKQACSRSIGIRASPAGHPNVIAHWNPPTTWRWPGELLRSRSRTHAARASPQPVHP